MPIDKSILFFVIEGGDLKNLKAFLEEWVVPGMTRLEMCENIELLSEVAIENLEDTPLIKILETMVSKYENYLPRH